MAVQEHCWGHTVDETPHALVRTVMLARDVGRVEQIRRRCINWQPYHDMSGQTCTFTVLFIEAPLVHQFGSPPIMHNDCAICDVIVMHAAVLSWLLVTAHMFPKTNYRRQGNHAQQPSRI